MASQSANDFAHLHVHSEYSLLDGYSRTKELVKYAAKLGMSSIALTDHGNMYGAIEFYEAAKAAGVKPILGVETYVAPGKMTAKSGQDRDYRHLILLAQDETGYRNLLKLVTDSWLEGYYYKPRMDRELLAARNAGLIALSACLGGEVAGPIAKGAPATAKQNAPMMKVTESRMRMPAAAATAGIHHMAKNIPGSRVRLSRAIYEPSATLASDKRSSNVPTTASRKPTRLYYRTPPTFQPALSGLAAAHLPPVGLHRREKRLPAVLRALQAVVVQGELVNELVHGRLRIRDAAWVGDE